MNASKQRRGVMLPACLLVCHWLRQYSATLIVALAATAADCAEPPENTYPQGRIYASIFFHDGATFGREVVAVDPQSGACETVAKNGLDPRVSPDGGWVAYWTMVPRTDPNSTQTDGEVWVKKLEPETAAIKVWAGDGAPRAVWSRDGSRVIVTAGVHDSDRKRWRNSLSLVNPETSETEPLDLPDSERVVDCAHHSDLRLMETSLGGQGMYTVLPGKSRKTMITHMKQSDYHGRFSPDDKRLVFLRREARKLKVCTADADGKNVQVAFVEKELTCPEDVGWSPDGKRVAVVLFDWTLDEQGRK